MARTTARTAPCPREVRIGRMRKADQFLEAAGIVAAFAEDETDVADACVTLFVHAGIAGADVICCSVLGEHPRGENHSEAVAMLATVDRPASRHLQTLLAMKSKAGYTHTPASADEVKRAARAAEALVERARTAPGG